MRKTLRFSIVVLLVVPLLLDVAFGQKTGKGGSSGQGAAGANQAGAAPSQGGAGGGGSAYFETLMLAYGGVNQLSEAISKQVCNAIDDKSTVIIYDQTAFQNLQAWEAFSSAAKLLEASYKSLLTPEQLKELEQQKEKTEAKNLEPKLGAAAAGAATGPYIAGSDLAGLISAFSASTVNNASTFTIADSTMAVSLQHQFLKNGTSCTKLKQTKYYPLFGTSADLKKATETLTTTLGAPNQVRHYIQTTNKFFTGKDDPKFLIFTDLNTSYDSLLATLISSVGQNQASSSSGASSISSILQGIDLETALLDPNAYLLYADVVAAGGTQKDKKNLLTVLFTGDWISYSGGLIVNVALTRTSTNAIVLADTLRYRTDYKHIRHPRESESVESVDNGDNEYSLCNLERRDRFGDSDLPASPTCPAVSVEKATQ